MHLSKRIVEETSYHDYGVFTVYNLLCNKRKSVVIESLQRIRIIIGWPNYICTFTTGATDTGWIFTKYTFS